MFGVGGWALVPAGEIKVGGNNIGRAYELRAWGRFLSDGMGEAEFNPNNPRISKFTETEIVASSALVRCCKKLGMGLECWDRRWTENFKAKYCEQYQDGNRRYWRVRKDAFAKP